jgi:hypothetical protein
MHLLGRLGCFALLVVALAATAGTLPAVTKAQDQQPQCSDQIDNDLDGFVDGADPGCGGGDDDDEIDSPYSSIVLVTAALPVLTLQGTVNRHGALDISRFFVRADRATVVDIRCAGRHCPFKRIERRMITTSLRIRRMERKLRPPMVVKMRLQRTGQLGRYVKYTLRRNKAPKRIDSCLDQTSGKVRKCFTG